MDRVEDVSQKLLVIKVKLRQFMKLKGRKVVANLSSFFLK